MRLRVSPAGSGQFRWSLVTGQRSVVDGAHTYDDIGDCRRAASDTLAAPAANMLAVQQPDGQWRWLITGHDGDLLARSSATFDTAAACGYDLHSLRRAWFTSQRPTTSATEAF